jgi:hypothetical protein
MVWSSPTFGSIFSLEISKDSHIYVGGVPLAARSIHGAAPFAQPSRPDRKSTRLSAGCAASRLWVVLRLRRYIAGWLGLLRDSHPRTKRGAIARKDTLIVAAQIVTTWKR